MNEKQQPAIKDFILQAIRTLRQTPTKREGYTGLHITKLSELIPHSPYSYEEYVCALRELIDEGILLVIASCAQYKDGKIIVPSHKVQLRSNDIPIAFDFKTKSFGSAEGDIVKKECGKPHSYYQGVVVYIVKDGLPKSTKKVLEMTGFNPKEAFVQKIIKELQDQEKK